MFGQIPQCILKSRCMCDGTSVFIHIKYIFIPHDNLAFSCLSGEWALHCDVFIVTLPLRFGFLFELHVLCFCSKMNKQINLN